MRRLVLGVLLAGGVGAVLGASADRFVFAQVERSGRWDPYPDLWAWAAPYLIRTTRLNPELERRTLRLTDDRLFESPFVVVAGRGSLEWTDYEIQRLSEYLSAGGLLFLDDTEASLHSPFARSVRLLPSRLGMGASWRPIPSDHALYRSFFLVRVLPGRKRADPQIQGLWMSDRLVAIWSSNDVMGALARDPLGRPLFACEPGGEVQRQETVRFFVNLVLFSVTGTYKTDGVHQPFLKQKGAP